MKNKFYVVFDRHGALRLNKKQLPALYRGEVAVAMTVTIPDSVFKNPIISADINVPEDAILQPTIEVEVDNPDAEPVA